MCELSGRTNRKNSKKNCAARGKYRLVENSLKTRKRRKKEVVYCTQKVLTFYCTQSAWFYTSGPQSGPELERSLWGGGGG